MFSVLRSCSSHYELQEISGRGTFEQQLTSAQAQLAAIRSKIGVKHSGHDNLLGAYYVLSFSLLEVYLKTFVEDALQAFGAASPNLEDWPEPMLGYWMHRAADLGGDYRRYQTTDDEGGLLLAVGSLGKKIAKWGNGGAALVF